MFNHSNWKLPLWLDRWLRLVVVTPDMHRVHHSAIGEETDSNYGFNLPWWDWLLGTYCVVTGIGPEIARTLVDLGVELNELVTLKRLRDGLQACLIHLRGRKRNSNYWKDAHNGGKGKA